MSYLTEDTKKASGGLYGLIFGSKDIQMQNDVSFTPEARNTIIATALILILGGLIIVGIANKNK